MKGNNCKFFLNPIHIFFVDICIVMLERTIIVICNKLICLKVYARFVYKVTLQVNKNNRNDRKPATTIKTLLINCLDINHNINDKSLNRVTCRLSLANPESNQTITCEL